MNVSSLYRFFFFGPVALPFSLSFWRGGEKEIFHLSFCSIYFWSRGERGSRILGEMDEGERERERKVADEFTVRICGAEKKRKSLFIFVFFIVKGYLGWFVKGKGAAVDWPICVMFSRLRNFFRFYCNRPTKIERARRLEEALLVQKKRDTRTQGRPPEKGKRKKKTAEEEGGAVYVLKLLPMC